MGVFAPPQQYSLQQRNEQRVPTIQQVYRGQLLSRPPQETPLRCNLKAGALTKLPENVPYFVPKVSANFPQMSSKFFEQSGAIFTKVRSHDYILSGQVDYSGCLCLRNLRVDTPTEASRDCKVAENINLHCSQPLHKSYLKAK